MGDASSLKAQSKTPGNTSLSFDDLKGRLSTGFNGSLIVGFQQYAQVKVSPHAMLLSLRKMEPMARGKIRFSGHRLRLSGKKFVAWFGGVCSFYS